MSAADRLRWDERYRSRGRSRGPAPVDAVGPPLLFADHTDEFPTEGIALDVACGCGTTAVWLARRGLEVWAFDISAVAVEQARELAQRVGADDRCRFDVVDLDEGLPPGVPVDVIVCHKFRARALDQVLVSRLAPGGLLAISALSEVDAVPGPFRAEPGELVAAFADLQIMETGEGRGEAWLMGRAVPRAAPPGRVAVPGT